MQADAALAAIFPGLLAFAAFSDLFEYKIPNWLSLLLVCAFLALAPLAGLTAAMMAQHGACSLAVLLGGLLFFSRGWIGGGDAKLAAAAALWLGWENLYPFLIQSALAGGALTIAVILLRAAPIAAIAPSRLSKLRTPGEGVPYGVAIAVSAIAVYSKSFWMAGFLLPL